MNQAEIFQAVKQERDYQNVAWGTNFDRQNTPNDWVAYMTRYLGKSVTAPFDAAEFRKRILQVVALGVAALEQEDYAPRHYDVVERI
jgi:hypothetical protein